ncbi:MAG TPA: adenosylcobinamide-GDP ribazoletransferase [Elusimicrobiota bacterium]|nr:adenosylcobinamide-GDP ribazoletransferase [Elusimicrobiota bacterium]
MNSFLAALRFLTVIPVKSSWTKDPNGSRTLIYFPVVGWLLGLALAVLITRLSRFSGQGVAPAMVVVVALVVLTGGLHLDGLADTFDALLSWKSKDEMLSILRDPHVGVMGILGLLCVLLLKIAFLSWVSVPHQTAALVLMCVLGRWGLVWSLFLFPYARPEGKAKAFAEGINRKIFFGATLVALSLILFFWQWRGLIAGFAAALSSFLVGHAAKKKLGGITGDTLGAGCELTETTVLLSVCLLERIPL